MGPSAMRSRQPNISVSDIKGQRILLVADVRGISPLWVPVLLTHQGDLSQLNTLADEYNVEAIVHTGDFGFLDDDSLGHLQDA